MKANDPNLQQIHFQVNYITQIILPFLYTSRIQDPKANLDPLIYANLHFAVRDIDIDEN